MTIPTTDICTALTELLNSMDYDRLFILTDVHTHSLCLPLILGVHAIAKATTITIPAGDEHKNLDTLSSVWDALEDGMATRHSILLCLGGGVVTDLGGFAAATFKRGIRFIHIPTTLLAMVDAATGGKTGINYGGLKNAIGVFQMPEQVLLCPDFLHTLDKENLRYSRAFLSEHDIIIRSVAYVRICLMRLCRGIIHFYARMSGAKILIVLVNVILKLRPVIKARTLEMPVIDNKAERLYQMQYTACRHAGTSYISGIFRYFRFMQHNIHNNVPGRYSALHFLYFLTNLAILSSATFILSIEYA